MSTARRKVGSLAMTYVGINISQMNNISHTLFKSPMMLNLSAKKLKNLSINNDGTGNVFRTHKISVRSVIHRVPIPSHIRSPVCPTFMVFTGKNKIPRKTKQTKTRKRTLLALEEMSL